MHPADGRRIRRMLIGFPIAVLLCPVLLIVALGGFALVVPAHSASTVIPQLQARLLLRFYYTWGSESGRYLTIGTPRGHLTINMTAFDWAHNSRTSIYLTPDRKLAALGPIGDDHILTVSSMRVNSIHGIASHDWVYLGAFDYDMSYGRRTLRFVTAEEQGECIPMRMEIESNAAAPRNAARQRNCAHYEPAKGRS
jgi:hypothetical protein